MDPRIERLARLLVRYSNSVRRDDVVEVRGTPAAAPLVEAVFREVLARGARARVAIKMPSLEGILLRDGNRRQIEYFRPTLIDDLKEVDCTFSVIADENTRALSSVDPTKQQWQSRAQRPLQELYFKRAAKGELRWVCTLYPTNAVAQDADMSLGEFTDFVYRACKCDRRDPVAAWKEVRRSQQKIVRFLRGKKTIRVVAPETDLTLSVQGRKWENCCGTENMPDGEVFTAPVENSVNGKVCFSFPACDEGREVEGVRLEFKKGRVVNASAEKNEDYLRKMLDTDEGARRLGEFAFGLNNDIQRFTKNILFDEKIGGTVHMAVGASYPETGGKNKSAIHWDMICDLRKAGEVYVDGRLAFKNGTWKI